MDVSPSGDPSRPDILPDILHVGSSPISTQPFVEDGAITLCLLSRRDLSTTFDLVADPLIFVDASGNVLATNAAAVQSFATLVPNDALPMPRSQAEGLDAFLKRCAATAEPVPGSISLFDPGGQVVRYLCRGRRLSIDGPAGPAVILLHLHAAVIERRFRLLIERLHSARRVMDERRRRERVLRSLLKEREDLLDRLKADREARIELERDRDEILNRLYNAGQNERQKLARDLHDHAGQEVVALNLGLGKLAKHLSSPQGLAEHESLLGQAQKIGATLRRVVVQLRPPALDEFGLVTAMRGMIEDWGERAEVQTDFDVVGDELPIANDVAITLYRIAQEALNNVSKHGGSVETVNIILRFGKGVVVLTIDDDGDGFDARPAELKRLFRAGRLGLVGMRERLLLIGGSLRIRSMPGKGTTITANVALCAGEPDNV